MKGAPAFVRDGATLRFSGDSFPVAVTVSTSRIVRVEMLHGGPPSPSHVVEHEWPAPPFDVVDGESVQITTSDLRVSVGGPGVRLTFADAAGTWLLRQPEHAGMSVEAERDGGRRVRVSFAFSGEQHFYGLGQGGAQFDRLGTMRQLWNTQLGHGPGSDMAVPLLVSNRGYALFFDNPADGAVSVGRSDGGVQIVYTAQTGPLVWYFLFGGDLRGVMREVAHLLGAAPMPPKWTLGFLQSTRHFDDTDEVRRLIRTIRERRIPCDGLILLSSYGDAKGWNRGVGHLEWQPKLWPEPDSVLAEARHHDLEIVTHEYPVLHEASPLFPEAEARGYLLASGYERGTGAANYREGQRHIDFSNPEAQAWWWSAHRQLVQQGVAGWWLDGGEGPPASAALHAGAGALLHNFYDRLRQAAFASGEANDRPEQRVFLLCRSGAAGMQRFGSACWSGDINNDFATLEAQVALGLNTGLSGVPYWGSDVGGFFHSVPETGELYGRWFQFAAFTPVFRSHGWVWREHVPWAHGPEVEAICRQYAELRYRLMPYTYTLAWQAHRLGLPLMRPLVLNYPDDPRVWTMSHQFLWGDDILVAPVTREGAVSWPVYFPAGEWHDFWTGAQYEGPCGVTVDAPLHRLPLFVRGGAIIPFGPVMQHTGEQPLDEVTLLMFPSGHSRFEMYEDDGRSHAYRRGGYALTAFECARDDREVTVRIQAPTGDRSVVPGGRRYLLQIWLDGVRRVRVDDRELSRRDDAGGATPGWWEDGHGFTWVRLPAQPAAVTTLRI